VQRTWERVEQRKLGKFAWSEWKSTATKTAREPCARFIPQIQADRAVAADATRQLSDAVAESGAVVLGVMAAGSCQRPDVTPDRFRLTLYDAVCFELFGK
jgi:hypothetical protein